MFHCSIVSYLDISVVHESWLYECIEKDEILPVFRFIIPCGVSILSSFAIFPPSYHNQDDLDEQDHVDSSDTNISLSNLFFNKRFINCTSNSWNICIEACGGIILKESLDKNTSCDYILIDNFEYCEASLVFDDKTNTKSKESRLISSLDKKTYDNIAMINRCQIALGRAIRTKQIIVTIEWLVYCISIGSIISSLQSNMLTLASHPYLSPLVQKAGKDNERFVIGDMVWYKSNQSNMKSLQVGRIKSFERRKKNSIESIIFVEVQRFIISNLEFSKDELGKSLAFDLIYCVKPIWQI